MPPRRRKPSPGRATLALAASRDRTSLFHLLVLSAATFALYASTFWSGFVLDDDYEVLKDQLIRSFANIPTLFAHGVWFFAGAKTENFYRPLKLLAYSVEYHLFGFHPAFWHLANILLHLAVVFAIYFLIRDLAFHLPSFAEATEGVPAGATPRPEDSLLSPDGAKAGPPAVVPPCGTKAGQLAFWSALFFAFHPIHVEAVAWIAAGNDLLCGLALLLSLWLYHRALYRTVQGRARLPRPEDSSGHLRRVAGARRGGKPAPAALLLYAGSVALFFAALLFKETALTFPAIILSYDFFYRGESLRGLARGWRRYVAYFATLGVYLALRIRALRGFAPASNRSLHLTLKDLVLSVPVLAVKYIWKALLPINQNWWYVWQPVRALSWKPIAAIAVVLALVLAMFWLRSPDSSGRGPDVERVQGAFKSGRRQPVLSLALAWFWLTLLPALDIFQVSANIVTDRYLYIPSFGFCVFAAWAWLWLRDRVAGPRAEVPQGGTKVGRAAAYACLLAFFAFYTAIIFRRAPDWHDDLSLLTRTAQQSPGAGVIQAMLGKVYIDQRSYPEAFGHLQRAVTLDPTNAFAHNDLGSILLILGHPDQAAAETQKAVELDPTLYPFWSNLCLIYTHQKEWARAAEVCEHAAQLIDLEFDARKLDTRINLAIALVHLGRLDPAADQLVAGLRAEPNSPDAYLGHYELGVIYEDKGLWQEAGQQYQQALSQNPRYVPARTQLEAVRAHLANPQP